MNKNKYIKNKSLGWSDYYKTHHGIRISNIILHWQYLLTIIINNPKNILEVGCGPADHSFSLSYLLPFAKISLLDNDKKIVSVLVKKKKKGIGKIYCCDILNKEMLKQLKFSINQFDLIYSQGLMEHFNDEDFKKIIINLMPYTKKFIMSVPGELYPNKDYGNEILRTKKKLNLILNNISSINFTTKSYFLDLGVRTKLIVVKNKKFNFFDSIKFLLFNSCHYLIVINKL